MLSLVCCAVSIHTSLYSPADAFGGRPRDDTTSSRGVSCSSAF